MNDIVIEREQELVAAEQALMRVPPAVTDALILQREPRAVLDEATKAATALMAVMTAKTNKVMMNGEQYLENEDWLTIGHFYGVTAQTESDRYVTFGTVAGWEATAVLIARDGRVLGRATSMCLNDEEKWSSRPKYEYQYCLGADPDHSKHKHSLEDPGSGRVVWEPNPAKPGKSRPRKERIRVDDEAVPLFQLRSMAQTRASSKVHASVLRFVPVLAGFKGTPAEELPDDARHEQDDVAPAPPPATAASPEARPSGGATPAAAAGGDPRPLVAPAPNYGDNAYREGWRRVESYDLRNNGWHELTLRDEDAPGGVLRLSTKKAIGRVAKEAFDEDVPVKVTTKEKPNAQPGEAYLETIEKWSGSDASL